MEEVVVLTGLMGAGKSATGHVLAELLGLPFVDLDEEVEGRAGKTVAAIFAEEGEDRFRDLEAEALSTVLARGRAVVATGGGALLRKENRRLLEGRKVFYLHTPPDECLRRLLGSPIRRPLLEVPNPREALERIYRKRAPLYESLGKRVETQGRSPADVARVVAEALAGCLR